MQPIHRIIDKFSNKKEEYIEFRKKNTPDDQLVAKLLAICDRCEKINKFLEPFSEELNLLAEEENNISDEIINDAYKNATDERIEELRTIKEKAEEYLSTLKRV